MMMVVVMMIIMYLDLLGNYHQWWPLPANMRPSEEAAGNTTGYGTQLQLVRQCETSLRGWYTGLWFAGCHMLPHVATMIWKISHYLRLVIDSFFCVFRKVVWKSSNLHFRLKKSLNVLAGFSEDVHNIFDLVSSVSSSMWRSKILHVLRNYLAIPAIHFFGFPGPLSSSG